MHCITCNKNLNNTVIYMAYDKSHCSEKCRDNTIRIYESKIKNDYLYYYMNNNIENDIEYLNISNEESKGKMCAANYLLIYIKNYLFQ